MSMFRVQSVSSVEFSISSVRCCVLSAKSYMSSVDCLVFRVETVSVPATVLVVAAVVLGRLVAMGLVAGGLVAAVARVALVGDLAVVLST